MPVDIGKVTTEVVVADGDLPLSAAQLEKLVQFVLRRLEEKRRAEQLTRDATTIRAQAAPPARA
jgi:hypothetical protein